VERSIGTAPRSALHERRSSALLGDQRKGGAACSTCWQDTVPWSKGHAGASRVRVPLRHDGKRWARPAAGHVDQMWRRAE